jgi:hypothetical protein
MEILYSPAQIPAPTGYLSREPQGYSCGDRPSRLSDRAKLDGFLAAATKLSPSILRDARHPLDSPYATKDQEAAR